MIYIDKNNLTSDNNMEKSSSSPTIECLVPGGCVAHTHEFQFEAIRSEIIGFDYIIGRFMNHINTHTARGVL